MSILLALLGKTWPYLAGAFVVGGLVGWTTHKFDSIELARQRAAFEGYKAQVADQDAKGQEAARNAVQAQATEHEAQEAHNAQVIDELQKRTTEAESHYTADRDLIRGLLESASQNPTPASHPVPESGHQPQPSVAGRTSGVEQVVELCAATKEEDQRNADRLDSLIAEVKPQVKP